MPQRERERRVNSSPEARRSRVHATELHSGAGGDPRHSLHNLPHILCTRTGVGARGAGCSTIGDSGKPEEYQELVYQVKAHYQVRANPLLGANSDSPLIRIAGRGSAAQVHATRNTTISDRRPPSHPLSTPPLPCLLPSHTHDAAPRPTKHTGQPLLGQWPRYQSSNWQLGW